MNWSSTRFMRLSAAILATVFVGACTGAADDPTTTSDTTSEPTATTQETSAPTTSPDTSSTETTSAETTPTDTGSTDSPSDPLPTNAADYATVAFDAWTAGDRDLLARLFTEQALQALDELSVDPAGDWEFVRCEGAAGSSYCSWMGPDGTLTFRVGNEAASAGEERAITEVILAGG